MLEALGINVDILLSLSILLCTAILFISNVVRVDVVAALVLVMIGISKLLPPDKLFSGFSSEAVISLIAVMIISAGLECTGLSVKVAKWMLNVGRGHHYKVSLLLMVTSGVMAGFMRSLGTVALFLPIVTKITARTGISKGFLLLPMAFCSILGGMLTMIGTAPLIILNSLLVNAYQYVDFNYVINLKPFKLFEVMPIGGMLLASGVVYLAIYNYRISSKIKVSKVSSGTTKAHFRKVYGKGAEIFECKVTSKCQLVNTYLRSIEQKLPESASVLAVMQNGDCHFPPLRKLLIKDGAHIAIMGEKAEILNFAKEHSLKVLPKLEVFNELLHSVKAGLSEAVIPPSSQLIGQEVRELHMRRNYQLHVLALFRGDVVYKGEQLNNLTLRSGDTLGMFSRWDALHEFQKNPDFFVLTTSYPRDKFFPKKLPRALFFFFLSVTVVLLGWFSIAVGLLIGAVGMIATGVLSVDQAYKAVSWKTVFLIAGLIPLGMVLQSTGTTEWLTKYLVTSELKVPIWVIQMILAITTSLLALVVSNVGATVLLVPMALELANALGADPRMFALIVAMAASNTFVLPTHQVNALIAGPGSYSVKEFVKVGGGMTIIFWVIMLLGLNIFF